MGHKHDMIQLFLLKYSVIQNTDQVEVCKRQFYYQHVSLDVILCSMYYIYVLEFQGHYVAPHSSDLCY